MLLKLGGVVAPYEIYQMVHILMLLWQQNENMKYYHLRLNKAKYLVLSKTHVSPTFIGSPL